MEVDDEMGLVSAPPPETRMLALVLVAGTISGAVMAALILIGYIVWRLVMG